MRRSPLLARADLLHALELAGDDGDTERRYAGALAFFERPPDAVSTSIVVRPEAEARVATGSAHAATPEPAATDRLQAPLFAITACRRLDVPADSDDTLKPSPLTPAQCAPRATDGSAAPFVPLVRRTRLWPALKRSALEVRQSGLDMPRLLRELARARPVRRLPNRRQAIWGGELVVIWDRAPHLLPYQEDFQEIVDDLLLQRGKAGCTLWLVDGSPQQVTWRWPARAGAAAFAAIPRPPAGTRVLILSDTGALAGWPGAARTWAEFTRRLAQHGAQPVVWAPLAPAQIEVELARRAHVFCLQAGGGLRRQRGRIADDEQRRAEAARLAALRERLLACMAFCVRVEPALLRALRGVAPATAGEPGLEALVWSHQPVVYDSRVSRAVTAEHVAHYRQAFGELTADEQVAALDRTLHIHAWRGQATEAAELLIWQAHARDEAQSACAAQVEEARRWFQSFRATATRATTPDPQLRQYTLDLFARNGADQRWVEANSEWLAPVWVATDETSSPAGLRPADLLRAISAREDLQPVTCQLGVQAAGLMLWAAERPSGPAHSRVGSPLQIKRLLVSEGEGRPARLLDPAASPQPVASLASLLDPAAALTLTAGQHSYRVSHIERPVWAQEIGRDASGLYADLLVPVESGEAPDGAQPIVQRMRYIEAGHFRMGSPAAEAERYEDEGPQHAVTLTQGFWLADSACTQALWQAVMGDNPSHFTAENQGGAQHPVEQVSWDDVQLFLRRLEARLPAGYVASLPSEAEWEYACRAGTTTPFSFGETITPEQVNYDGRYPYAGGSKGLYRQATVPVRSLPANDWGLYEMHGNVWEWCADGRRAYAERDETDPRGAEGQSVSGRALRGGSWDDGAWFVRSADRLAFAPVYAYQLIGFRFALRSTSPAGATEWPAPRSGADGAAGRGTVAAPGTGAATKKRRKR